jgi:hypothetical protein
MTRRADIIPVRFLGKYGPGITALKSGRLPEGRIMPEGEPDYAQKNEVVSIFAA